jgi:hypothetical protein
MDGRGLRLDPKGEFYLWRNLPDDVTDQVKVGKALDPIIVILRVAEASLLGWHSAKRSGGTPRRLD